MCLKYMIFYVLRSKRHILYGKKELSNIARVEEQLLVLILLLSIKGIIINNKKPDLS